MKSIRQQIITYIKTLSFDYDVTVRPSHSKLSPKYPMITVQEIANTTRQSIHGEEHYANLGYQINVYSKDMYPASADTVCLNIISNLDTKLQKTFGFKRTNIVQLPDVNDDTVMRYAIRYGGILDTINNYLYN